MRAFTDTPVTKAQLIAQLEAHRAADEIVQGQYWKNGKGCAVGCSIHGSNHMEYERQFGIPVMLAQLEDCIFEGLSNAEAKDWPLRFTRAVPEGADLSLVGWQFLHWLVTDTLEKYGTDAAARAAAYAAADAAANAAAGLVADAARAARAARAAAYAADAANAAGAAVNAYARMADKLIELIEATAKQGERA